MGEYVLKSASNSSAYTLIEVGLRSTIRVHRNSGDRPGALPSAAGIHNHTSAEALGSAQQHRSLAVLAVFWIQDR